MKILAYQGTGLVSRLIRLQTRSKYSHIAVELPDTSIIEAWSLGGVDHNASYATRHRPGTIVHRFAIDHDYDGPAVEQFLHDQIGKKYDFSAIARFISRRNEPADDRWFCSELALAAFPFLLQRMPPSHTTPRDIVMSPYLRFETTLIV